MFDEKTAYKPIISSMILATGEPVNLLYANMDALLDEQRGQMVICLSDNKEAAERQKAFLIKEGVEFTKTIAATKGRASYLGERSIGHQDPGATSATITLECIRDFIAG